MIGCLNHIAIVVPDLEEAALKYKQTLGAEVSEQQELIEHGVTLVFVQLANTKIELLHPLGANSCLLYTSPSPRDKTVSRMPSSA